MTADKYRNSQSLAVALYLAGEDLLPADWIAPSGENGPWMRACSDLAERVYTKHQRPRADLGDGRQAWCNLLTGYWSSEKARAEEIQQEILDATGISVPRDADDMLATLSDEEIGTLVRFVRHARSCP